MIPEKRSDWLLGTLLTTTNQLPWKRASDPALIAAMSPHAKPRESSAAVASAPSDAPAAASHTALAQAGRVAPPDEKKASASASVSGSGGGATSSA